METSIFLKAVILFMQQGKLGFSWIFLLLTCVGCASTPIKLIHPHTGEIVLCSSKPKGSNFIKESRIKEYAAKYEAKGFIILEKRTPERRDAIPFRRRPPKTNERYDP